MQAGFRKSLCHAFSMIQKSNELKQSFVFNSKKFPSYGIQTLPASPNLTIRNDCLTGFSHVSGWFLISKMVLADVCKGIYNYWGLDSRRILYSKHYLKFACRTCSVDSSIKLYGWCQPYLSPSLEDYRLLTTIFAVWSSPNTMNWVICVVQQCKSTRCQKYFSPYSIGKLWDMFEN